MAGEQFDLGLIRTKSSGYKFTCMLIGTSFHRLASDSTHFKTFFFFIACIRLMPRALGCVCITFPPRVPCHDVQHSKSIPESSSHLLTAIILHGRG